MDGSISEYVNPLSPQVKFGDVAGCDGAKTELVEVVDFLKNASR